MPGRLHFVGHRKDLVVPIIASNGDLLLIDKQRGDRPFGPGSLRNSPGSTALLLPPMRRRQRLIIRSSSASNPFTTSFTGTGSGLTIGLFASEHFRVRV
jgi:hypothetical protein